MKKNTDNYRSLELSLIICETELDLSWRKKFRISEMFNTPEIDPNPPVVYASATSATSASFKVNSTKRYVPGIPVVISYFIHKRFILNHNKLFFFAIMLA